MQETLFQQGFDLMLFGMGTVFIFLALLVVFTTVMSKCVLWLFPEEPEVAEVVNNSTTSTSTVDAKTMAIIKEAIRQHRSQA